MPDPYWPKRNGSYTLADAAKHNRFASILCTYCKRTRYYFVADLKTAFGNVECDDVIRVAGLHCSGCDGKGSLDFKLGGGAAAYQAAKGAVRTLTKNGAISFDHLD